MRAALFIALLAYSTAFVIPHSFAQAPEEEGAQNEPLRDRSGDYIGLGPKGRLSQAQGGQVALKHVPGEILGQDIFIENGRHFYAYKILAPDRSIYEVELYAATGKVYEIEVEYLSSGAVLPMDILPENVIRVLAVNYVAEETMGKRKPQIRSLAIGARKRKPVYMLEVKKAGQLYSLFLDAVNGDVLEIKKKK